MGSGDETTRGQARAKDGVLAGFSGGAAEITRKSKNSRDTETAKMRMPEPEEDKVTATGGGLRASGSGGDYINLQGRVRHKLLHLI